MPSKSAAQAKFMRAAAHSPSFAKKVGIKPAVAKEFVSEDKRRPKKFADGGDVPEGGRFAQSDPDIYTRARKFVEEQQAKTDSAPAPKAAPKPAAKPTPAVKPAAKPDPAATRPSAADIRKVDTAMAEKAHAARMRPEAQAIKADTSIEENILGGAGLRALKGIKGAMSGAKAAEAAPRTSGALAERFDKITPIPNRTAPPAAQKAISGPRSAGDALPAPKGAPQLGGPSSAARLGTAATPKGLPAPKPAAKAAPVSKAKPQVGAPKPAAKPTSTPKSEPMPRRTKKFNDDEAGVEFKSGGAVKRGWGKARCK